MSALFKDVPQADAPGEVVAPVPLPDWARTGGVRATRRARRQRFRRTLAWGIACLVAACVVAVTLNPTPQPAGGAVALAAVAPPPVLPRNTAATGTVVAAAAPAASMPSLPQLGGPPPTNPEARLMRVYALMAASQGDKALEEAERLAKDVPHFGLAQLAYADLLKGRTAPLPNFGAVAPPAAATPRRDAVSPADSTPAERLQDLSAEARARVGGVTHVPPAGTVPAQFVFMAPEVRFAIAVDATRSRLYLFENSPSGMLLKRDYYASVGKLGISKRIEGDLRTPLGVYFVTSLLPKAKLADRYGESALTLNYPNQYDKMRGRTGSGIWLHGVESTNFSRAPLATDGCVAVSNPDLVELTRMVGRQNTPVVISERLDWVPAHAAHERQAGFVRTFEAWREARQALDAEAELKFFSPTLRTPDALPLPVAAERLRGERARRQPALPEIRQLSMLSWHDQDDLMLVTYAETTARDRQQRLKRQYWMRQGDAWAIIFDGSVG